MSLKLLLGGDHKLEAGTKSNEISMSLQDSAKAFQDQRVREDVSASPSAKWFLSLASASELGDGVPR